MASITRPQLTLSAHALPKVSRHALAASGLLALLLVIFVPFGFNNKPLVEEWGFINAFRHGQGFFYVRPTDHLRPLLASWTYLSYIVDPTGLRGFTVVLFTLLYLKSVVVYALAYLLTRRNVGAALLIAAFFTVVPADAGVFNYRAIAIHAASLLYFSATLAFILLVTRPRWNWRLIALMSALLMWGLLTYNGGYALVVFTPALVLALPKTVRFRARRAALWWYGTFLIAIAVTLISSIQGAGSYEAGVFSLPSTGDAITALVVMLARQFLTGWVESASALSRPLWLVLSALVGVSAGAVVYHRVPPVLRRDAHRLAFLGVAVVLLGYIIYLPTAYRFADWRVAYYSSAGVALVLVTGVCLIRSRRLRALVAGLLLMLGTAHALQQYDAFAATSERLQTFLQETVEHVPILGSQQTMVVAHVPPPQSCHEWMVYHHGYLVDALRYAYQSDQIVNVIVPDDDSLPWRC